MSNKLEFIAEIKATSQVKKASLDNEYKVVLVTDDSRLLGLGAFSPDVMVKVTVEVHSGN